MTAMAAQPHELILGLLPLLPALPIPSNASTDLSAVLPQHTRRSWLSPVQSLLMEFDRERVKRATKEPGAASLSEHRMEMKQHSTR